MEACLGHIFKSNKGIEMKIGTYLNVDKRKGKRQEP